MEQELFKRDKPRRTNGQYATKEVAYADRMVHENIALRLRIQQLTRQIQPTIRRANKLEREMAEWKSRYNELLTKIKTLANG